LKNLSYIHDNLDAFLSQIVDVFYCRSAVIRKALIRLKITLIEEHFGHWLKEKYVLY